MHDEALNGARQMIIDSGVAQRSGCSVLDIGGRFINGSVRHLFDTEDWTTLDIVEHDSVDIVADARSWIPDRRYDIAVCTEVLEHVDRWDLIVATCAKAADILILTCASEGRIKHSCTGAALIPPGEHYGNVLKEDLRSELYKHYDECMVHYRYPPGDLYAWASKGERIYPVE